MTVEVAGSVDGTNWTLLAVRSISGGSYVAAVASTAAGAWVAACAGFSKIRARVTAYTSGAATATLLAATGLLDDRLLGEVSSNAATITAALSTAANRRHAAVNALLKRQLAARIKQIEGQLAEIDAAIMACVMAAPDLERRFEILCSIPGIGKMSHPGRK